jgi:hypothetical protein
MGKIHDIRICSVFVSFNLLNIYKPCCLIFFSYLGMVVLLFDYFIYLFITTTLCVVCSCKVLHFHGYSLPNGVSTIVPSGVNNNASYRGPSDSSCGKRPGAGACRPEFDSHGKRISGLAPKKNPIAVHVSLVTASAMVLL